MAFIISFFLSFYRFLRKNLFFFVCNVLGLTIGVATVLLIQIYLQRENSFDTFHEDAERIYRVALEFKKSGVTDFQAATNYPKVGPALSDEFSEVESYCRLFRKYHGGTVTVGNENFREENLYYADSTFFDLFSFEPAQGTAKKLSEPHTAFVEEATARKYFGDRDPVGQRISVGSMDGVEEFEVVGVFRTPGKTHLPLTVVFSYSSLVALYGPDANDSWGWYDFYTYIKLKPAASAKDLQAKLPAFADKHGGDRLGSNRINLFLQPLLSIHRESKLMLEASVNGDQKTNSFLFYLGLAVLLVAWINYVNLTLAKTFERSKETGIRQIIGSSKSQIFFQFLMESFVINLVAILLSLLMVYLALPWLNVLTGTADFTPEIFTQKEFWITLFSIYCISSFLSGFYPAGIAAAFQPLSAMKGIRKSSSRRIDLRKSLVVSQFVASCLLITGSFIAVDQMIFMRSQNLGVDLSQLLIIRTPDIITNNETYGNSLTAYRDALLNSGNVIDASVSSEIPGKKVGWYASSRLIGQDQTASTTLFQVTTDSHYLNTYRIKLLAGRNFTDNAAAENHSVIVNPMAISALGISSVEEAIGQRIRLGSDTLTVVGVIDNYHHEGLKEPFRPTVFRYIIPQEMKFFSVKISGQDPKAMINDMRERYSKIFPGVPFEYFFVDSFYEKQYDQDSRFLAAFHTVAVLAFIIALLGLFGLASYTIAQRRKEVGIRKVLGSTERGLVVLLSKEFMQLVLLANILSVPLTLFIMDQWLTTFTFRSPISITPFLVAGVVSMLTAFFIVARYTLSAAKTNPVTVLRSE